MSEVIKMTSLQKLKLAVQKFLKNLRQRIRAFSIQKKLVNVPLRSSEAYPQDYFVMARSWADDFYTQVLASRNRWQAACLWVLSPLIFILLLCVLVLVPAQHLVPLIVHEYDNGIVTVTPSKTPYVPSSSAEVESDLARYVRFRESYSSDTYNYSYRLINLMSAGDVADQYDDAQSTTVKTSPINLLGDHGYQSVKIQSIVFLDNATQNDPQDPHATHRNLAQVDFVVSTVDKQTGKAVDLPLTALVSWTYGATPEDPSDRWMNWNGFRVTSYQITQRNL